MPPKIEQWFFEYHARVRQRELGITEDQIKDAVFTGRSWIQGKGARGGVKWAFEKVIDGDTLRVAGEVKGNAVYISNCFLGWKMSAILDRVQIEAAPHLTF